MWVKINDQLSRKKEHSLLRKKKAIAEEVRKLLEVKVIEPCDYPEWLSNYVMVKKANGS